MVLIIMTGREKGDGCPSGGDHKTERKYFETLRGFFFGRIRFQPDAGSARSFV